MRPAREIEAMWEEWKGTVVSFTRMLEKEGIEYLSFSMVNALESCPMRYLLEYVDMVKVRPEPGYFLKGRMMHEAAARIHRGRVSGRRVSFERIQAFLERRLDEEDATHVGNALTLMGEQVEDDWEVVAVEEPFVLEISPDLPVCIGVVDLIERSGRRYRVIDHKGGRKFYEPDPLQVALYREHVRRRYEAKVCLAYYDEYRWVNSLERIRKPAFQRTRVSGHGLAWSSVVGRIEARYREMRRIRESRLAAETGNCWACHLGGYC